MANKKKISRNIEPMDQAQQTNDIVQQMQEIEAIDEQTKIMQQQSKNMSHDIEHSQFQGQGALAVIGKNEIDKAYKILLKYKEAKSPLEAKIAENEEIWKMNHWDLIANGNDERVKPRSAWLFNMIINKHADAMDNFPEANILPRAKDDEDVAKTLSSVIPVILEQNDYEKVYSDCQWYKDKNGASIQGIFWNNDKNNGLGDIDIKKIDILNLFWKAGINDIQDSPNVFHVVMVDNEELQELYPDIKVGNAYGAVELDAYKIGDDTSEQSAVVDWYYKKRVAVTDNFGIPKTKTVLHYCKFCNGQVIYASENDPNYADRGWYEHGLYPFVVDALYPQEKNIIGISYIDIEKDDQFYIDKLKQAVLESAIVNARPRNFIRDDGAVNEDEYLDISNPLIHVSGSLDDAHIRPVANTQFNPAYINVLQMEVQEMKETSGNTAASQGQTSNVTSASGIASLQEASGKLSRDSNKASYRAYKLVVNQVIELIRQFYDEPRCFRIAGDKGQNEFISFDNSGLIPQQQGSAMGIDLGTRLPIVDIRVVAQKQSAYTKETQNQTALNLYGMGFFAPNNADAALACLDMMNFEDIEKVRENVSNNGTMLQLIMQMQQQIAVYQQQLMQMGAIVDARTGSNITEGVAREAQATASNTQRAASSGQSTGSGSVENSRGSLSTQAASATRGSTAPR